MWFWRRMEKISWIDCVRNEELLKRVEKKRNILHSIKIGKADPMVTSCVGTAYYNTSLKER